MDHSSKHSFKIRRETKTNGYYVWNSRRSVLLFSRRWWIFVFISDICNNGKYFFEVVTAQYYLDIAEFFDRGRGEGASLFMEKH